MKRLIFFIIAAAAVLTGEVFAQQAKDRDKNRYQNVFPPDVKTIALIAPGSHPGREIYPQGVQLLRNAGYNVKVMPHAFVRQEKVARAPLAGRLADFYQAWNDPEVDMILCLRGGVGSEELLANLDWTKLKARPNLYFQGFSDITFINSALIAKKMGHPIAGPSVGTLTGLTDDSIEVMRKVHHGEQVGPLKLKTLVPGDCKGLPIAGLLSRFAIIVDKDYCPDTTGKIIFIEGVGIQPVHVKAQFEKLLEKKFFANASGVVFCQFVRCGSAQEIDAIITEFAPKIGVPVYRGFPLGHTTRHYAVDTWRPVEIKDGKITFPAVKKK